MNFIYKKEELFSFLILFIAIIISGLVLWSSINIYWDIFSLILLTVGAVISTKFNLAHPNFWFSSVFTLYSISYPIILLNDMSYDIYVYTPSLMKIQWIALTTFVLVVGVRDIDYYELKNTRFFGSGNKVFLYLLLLMLIPSIYEFITGGYTHKSEIYLSQSLIGMMGMYTALATLILYSINIVSDFLRNNKLNKKLVIVVGLAMFSYFFFTGERDIFLRFAVLMLFVYYIFIAKSKLSWKIVLASLGGLFLVPILAQFKYFGLTGNITYSESNNIILDLFNTEFSSASKNLQIVLLDYSSKGLFEWKTLLSSIGRALNLNDLYEFNDISSLRWFNETYFSTNRAGQGFSLVADGYVNAGIMGVIVIFFVLGSIVRILYRYSNKSVYIFSLYIVSIPTIMYSIRGDFTALISPLIKQNILLILVIWFLNEKVLSEGTFNNQRLRE